MHLLDIYGDIKILRIITKYHTLLRTLLDITMIELVPFIYQKGSRQSQEFMYVVCMLRYIIHIK